jgi:hypothetical protein
MKKTSTLVRSFSLDYSLQVELGLSRTGAVGWTERWVPKCALKISINGYQFHKLEKTSFAYHLIAEYEHIIYMTWQYCPVEFLYKISDKMVIKGNFLKVINLYYWPTKAQENNKIHLYEEMTNL